MSMLTFHIMKKMQSISTYKFLGGNEIKVYILYSEEFQIVSGLVLRKHANMDNRC